MIKANTTRKVPLTTNFRELDDQKLAEFWQSWSDYVKKIGGERVLVFNVKDGIEPLAKFCGKPVPKWPFPHVNDSAVSKFKNI